MNRNKKTVRVRRGPENGNLGPIERMKRTRVMKTRDHDRDEEVIQARRYQLGMDERLRPDPFHRRQ